MILDGIIGVFLSLVLSLVSLLPATGAVTLPVSTEGFGQAIAVMKLLDGGLPVHETLSALAGYVAATVAIDGYILLRALARWLPSWITGGG